MQTTLKAFQLRIGRGLQQRMQAHHLRPGKTQESLSYAWGRCERVLGGWVVLLPDHAPWFPFDEDCFLSQSHASVRLRPDVLNGMLVEFAASDYNCLVNIHDHWFARSGVFSAVDDNDDVRFNAYLRNQLAPCLARQPELGAPREIFHLSIVLGQETHAMRMWGQHGPIRPTHAAIVDDLYRQWPMGKEESSMIAARSDAIHARQSAVISQDQQSTLASIHVAIAGCGGLGSVAAESLLRLGVRRFTLVDSDSLEMTNLNRWQGAQPTDVGRPKARLLAQRLREMAPDVQVRAVVSDLTSAKGTSALASADTIVGCLDNDPARWHLNHLAIQFLVPYFDAGVRIVAGPPANFSMRYFAVLPGVSGCVECKGPTLVNQDEVLSAYGNPHTQEERRAAGYVVDAPGAPAPSAYMVNQRAASMLSMELANFFIGWRPTATLAYEHWLHADLRRLDRSSFPETPSPECPVCSFRLGVGMNLRLPALATALFPPDLPSHRLADAATQ